MPPSGAAVLLDAHVWARPINNDRANFGPASLACLQRAAEEGTLVLSVISVWEVVMLRARHRFALH